MTDEVKNLTNLEDISGSGSQAEFDPQAMVKAGVHIGHRRFYSNPKMKPYIWSTKNTFQIIDLSKTVLRLKEALDFLVSVREKGGVILWLGTNIAAHRAVLKTSQELNSPYVVERWLGGTLTNWPAISSRISYLKELETRKAQGDFEKYTKFEAQKMEEKISKLNKNFAGLKSMTKLPDALWVSSAFWDKIAVMEARKKKIPVVGLVDTNADPTELDWPIPANDSSKSALDYLMSIVSERLYGVVPKEVFLEEEKKK